MRQEVQPNKYLTGPELRQIIIKDLDDILQQDGMLAPHIGYPRVSYEVIVKIKTSNPMTPNWSNKTSSKKSTKQQIEKNPPLEAVETFPHVNNEGDEPIERGVMRTRDIVSPNASRIENDLPVPVTFRDQDGEIKEAGIRYDNTDYDVNGEGFDKVGQKELTKVEFDSKEK